MANFARTKKKHYAKKESDNMDDGHRDYYSSAIVSYRI